MTANTLNKFMSAVLVIGVISILYGAIWTYVTTFPLQIQGNMTIERGVGISSSDRKYALLDILYKYSRELSNENKNGQHSKTNESLSRPVSNISNTIEAAGFNANGQNDRPPTATEHNSVSTEWKKEQNNLKIKIGILIPSSTRNLQMPVLNNLPLVKISIPSLYKTFEKKYLYKVYIGVDKGDRLENFYDKIKSMFDCAVMVAVVGRNFVKSVNTIAERAYNDGMDYLVRINDDTKFVTANWTSFAIERLKEYIPPNIGVVGPTCNYGNTDILTHDMVHRTHLEIFNFYYPPYFENWWADDWITRVYEPDRSFKLQSWTVKHLDGTLRYKVDFERKSWVGSIIEYDRKRLKKYLDNPPTY